MCGTKTKRSGETLRNSLIEIGGARGSSVLVTTRNQQVIDDMQCSVSYPLEKLSDEDSYKLLREVAFSPEKGLDTKAFAALGREMVKDCSGLPLAIRALGGLLYSKRSLSKNGWMS